MAKKYSKELEELIISQYNSGVSPYKMVKNIPELYGKRPSVIYGILKRNNIKSHKAFPLTDEQRLNRRKYNVNDNYFETIDDEHKAYWLGFIYADGYITSTEDKIGISLSENDKEHLNKFKTDIQFSGPINTYKIGETGYNDKTVYSRIMVTSKKMKNDLKRLGVSEHKTDILKFPSSDQIPYKYLNDFIRGYIDGDGSITHSSRQKSGTWNYCIKIVGTLDMIENIQKFLNTNLKLEQRYPDRNKNNYQITIGGNQQVKKILDTLYSNATIFLDRKYNRYKQLLSSMANATEDHRE